MQRKKNVKTNVDIFIFYIFTQLLLNDLLFKMHL